MESKDTYNHLIVDTFRQTIWKTVYVGPEASSRGTSKLEFEVWRVCGIDQRPCTLPVTSMHGASLSEYTCCLNIHSLLCMYVRQSMQLQHSHYAYA